MSSCQINGQLGDQGYKKGNNSECPMDTQVSHSRWMENAWFLLSPLYTQLTLWPVWWEVWVLSPKVKWLTCNAMQSRPSSAEVKNVISFTYISQSILMAGCISTGATLTLIWHICLWTMKAYELQSLVRDLLVK